MIKNRCSPLVLFIVVGAFLLGAAGAQASQPGVLDGCVAETGANGAGINNPACTANDVRLTAIVPGSLSIIEGCTGTGNFCFTAAGVNTGVACSAPDKTQGTCPATQLCLDTVTFTATGQFQTGPASRYDVGLFISTDTDPDNTGAKFGSCERWAFTNVETGENFDADTCGDLLVSTTTALPFGPVTIPCVDKHGSNPDGTINNTPDGLVDINHCETWGNGPDEVGTGGPPKFSCSNSTDVSAGTGSKCFCGELPGACISLPDSNLCDVESCQGQCEPASGTGGSGTACIDNSQCTVAGETCRNITLTHTPINCNDGNACTTDSCDPAVGCVHTAVVCNDGNACTTNSCDPATGCTFPSVSCDDGNPCTDDACDPATGCTHTPHVCNDGNACTTDTCDPAKGGCVYTPISCDDGNACTTDGCDAATGCTHTAVNCNDSNACTTDACDPATGCTHTAINCNDGNACTTDACDPATGCTHTAVNCNDSNACTTDGCDPATGCTHTAVNCNDSNACTTDGCDPATGCTHTAVNCNDSNACTTDGCDPATGCTHTAVDCNDGNACTTDGCDPATGCTHTAISCDDGNACTTDSCDPVDGCKHTPAGCDEFCTFTQGFWGSAASASGQFDFRSADEILCCLVSPSVKVGLSGRSLTITDCRCIEQRLPASGPPAVLPAGDQSVDYPGCTSTVPLNKQGRFNNTLLGQTITLTLNLRLDAALGSFILPASITTVPALPGADGVVGEPLNCVIGAGGANDDSPNSTDSCTSITRNIPLALQGLTVNQLLALANTALGGGNTGGVSLSDINLAVTAINESFDQCRFIGSCPVIAISGAPVTQ